MFDFNLMLDSVGGASGGLNIASTLFNIYGGYQKANSTAAMLNYQTARQNQTADSTEQVAGINADKLRVQGKRAASGLTAGYAASGVATGSGSAQFVQGELSRRVELDALSTMLAGKYQAYGERVGAAESTAAAANAKTSAIWNTGGSLLGGLTRSAEMTKWGNSSRLPMNESSWYAGT